jgi:predicted acetyltransferase
MMQAELRELSPRDGIDILEMLREIGPGENGFQNNAYNVGDEDFKDLIYKWIDNSRGIGLGPGYVPQAIFWLYIDGKPVGMSKLRRYLTGSLRNTGGHIGYCIRPSERGRGYGNMILRETLKKAAQINIPRALLTCEEGNTASRLVIESCGGILERIDNGKCYYWIQLDIDGGIREIHPDDYGEMIEMWRNTPGMGIGEADTETGIRRFLLNNPGLSFCYKQGNRIVGTSLCGHDYRRGYIYHTAVLPEYRGRGIGRMLVRKNLEQLKAAGIDKCHLFVFADNEPGNGFWSSMGWKKRNDIFVYSHNI